MGKYVARNDSGNHRIASDDPRAVALLKEEHHIFRELFDRAEEADGDELVAITEELCMRLTVHMTIEEEILYPALRPLLGDDEVDEGIVEHQSGKRIVAELEQLDGDEQLYKAKVHVLGEETIHHVDEEDDDMFEDAKKAHSEGRIDLDAVGDQLRARQAELYDQLANTGETGRTREAMPDEVPTA